MCVRCLAALRSLEDCENGVKAPGSLALGDGGQSASSPVVTDYRSILYYLDGGDNFRWNAENDLGSSVMVTYSFGQGANLPTTSSSSDNPFGASAFSAFTEDQRNSFRLAAAEFMSVSGIILVEAETGGDINIFNAHGSYVGGYADLPYVNGSYNPGVELVVDSSGSYAPGSYGYYTVLHELGHALGLDHTHEGAYTLDSSLDSTALSVMSYNYDQTTYGLKSLDKLALQDIYGGSVISAGWALGINAKNGRLDGSGSNFSDAFSVPLTVEAQAVNTKIFGLDGNDTLSGQDSVDILRGNRGNDVLVGKGGNDKLRGGGGNDTINGGAGNDFIHGGSGSDVIYAGGGNDVAIGGAASDRVHGDGGNDVLSGLLNEDTLDGGAGNDTLIGGRGDDILTGGAGADIFVFEADAGHDRVMDFNASMDILRFTASGLNIGDIQMSDQSGFVRLAAGAVEIDLIGLTAADLSGVEFEFL